MITHYRSRLLNMVPKAIGVYDEALGSDDLRIAATAATKLLEGFQVLPKGGMEQTPSKPDRRQQKLLMLGSVMDMMPQKSCRYAVPVPPELSDVEEEVKKRM